MPDVSEISRLLAQLDRSCTCVADMHGYTDDELQELFRVLTNAERTHARIENELARREGVAAGWIPAL